MKKKWKADCFSQNLKKTWIKYRIHLSGMANFGGEGRPETNNGPWYGMSWTLILYLILLSESVSFTRFSATPVYKNLAMGG